MPRAGSVCSRPGCPELRPCRVHDGSRSARNHYGIPRQARGHGAAFERARRELLAVDRDCALRLPGCTGYATTADYIVPVSQGGTLEQGLQPACAHCQNVQGAALARVH